MHANEAWIAMFRQIPIALHDTLALGLTTGSEIVIQRIVQLASNFMIIRGRLAGTQDAGRIVLIPYEQLAFLAVQRDLKDAEVEAIFGQDAPGDFAALPVNGEPLLQAEYATVIDTPSEVKKPAAVSKSALVAKLRDRLK
ncbi:MAG: hypothetical protein EXR98_22870 [Gemmataceae bacterium]|nr:hypothetical protein [Gemmataceae bacterium]